MKPTEILENEHRVIEHVLACLEKMVGWNEKSKKLDCEAAQDMIEFFRMFADRFHHAKEERHLFAVLEAHGMPRDGGPTGVMLAEHEMGRNFVGGMEKALKTYKYGNAEALKDFARAARSYVVLLREHIQKEDHCLFAMTNQSLSDKEQAELLEAFRSEEGGAGKPLKYYQKKAQELGERYQVSHPDFKGGAFACEHQKMGSCERF